MNGFQLMVLLAVSVAAVSAGVVAQRSPDTASPASNTQQLQQSSVALSRPRRWILSWLLGHGVVIEHVESKRNAVNSTQDEAAHRDGASNSTRHDGDDDDSAEVHDLPNTIDVDLSSDTRVNYQDGHGRVGAMAQESDAEVFDWNLFQADKDKNARDVNPHYYQSNSVTGAGPGSGQASSAYGSRPARTATGLLSNSRGQGASEYRVNAFNRFPISYEQSQEYANSRQRN